jgi:hypothetical protein
MLTVSSPTNSMGMRYVQLEHSYTGNSSDGSAVLHVSQLPPNPSLLVPGPALLRARFKLSHQGSVLI